MLATVASLPFPPSPLAMPSLTLTKRKKKKDEAAEASSMATGGRYRRLQDHQSPLLAGT